MTGCQECGGSGWLIIERRGVSAARPCACRQNKANEAPDPNDEPLTDQVASAVVDAFCDALEYAPHTALGKSLVVDAVMSMCATNKQAWWLARRAVALYTRWGNCGIPGLRQILCSKFSPRDGLMISCTDAYPEGVPSERAVVEPVIPLLPAGRVSADVLVDRAVERVTESKRIPPEGQPFPVKAAPVTIIPDGKAVTWTDIDLAVQRLREEKAQRLDEAARVEIDDP